VETERSNWSTGGPSRLEETKQVGKEKAKEAAHKARTQLRELANNGREQIAGQMGAVARALRGEQLGDVEGEQVRRYTNLVGDRVDRVAQYLRDRDALDLVNETESFARRNPLLFLGGCALVGVALGRFFHASAPTEALPVGVGEDIGGLGTGATPNYAGYASYGVDVEVAPPVVTTPIVSTPDFGDVSRRTPGGRGNDGGRGGL
jgi:hypothetical protein